MDDAEEHAENSPSPARARQSMNSKALPYGTEEMSGFFSDEWDSGWEINHTVVPPR